MFFTVYVYLSDPKLVIEKVFFCRDVILKNRMPWRESYSLLLQSQGVCRNTFEFEAISYDVA
jgi:hypothetical protein